MSSPAVVLAAAAQRTERIRLTSAVSVISSDDPVRVFQDFATLDLLSGGRAEIMAGRGSFTESFPLFGYDLNDYDELFEEKLKLLIALREDEHLTWSGRHRSPLDGRVGVYPRPVQDPLPIWVAVGGAPESAFRAGTLGLPMAIAIIGGLAERFAPFAELHHDAARQAGFDPVPPISINSHGYIAETTEQAIEESFPYVAAMMNTIGKERGWPPMTMDQYAASATLHGANFVGSPQDVIDKILFQYDVFHHDRFLVQFSVGHAAARQADALDRAPGQGGRARREAGTRPPGLARPPLGSRRRHRAFHRVSVRSGCGRADVLSAHRSGIVDRTDRPDIAPLVLALPAFEVDSGIRTWRSTSATGSSRCRCPGARWPPWSTRTRTRALRPWTVTSTPHRSALRTK